MWAERRDRRPCTQDSVGGLSVSLALRLCLVSPTRSLHLSPSASFISMHKFSHLKSTVATSNADKADVLFFFYFLLFDLLFINFQKVLGSFEVFLIFFLYCLCLFVHSCVFTSTLYRILSALRFTSVSDIYLFQMGCFT